MRSSKSINIKKTILFLILLSIRSIELFAQEQSLISQKYKVGLLIMATGKYIQFVEPLIESAKKHFCANHDVTYFVFTDGEVPRAENIVPVYQKRLGWPYDTLMRFEIYNIHRDALKSMDYLFACDADMLFADTVGDEILGDLVGTLHPGFVGTKGTYEYRSISKAYIDKKDGKHYFAGGFNGGEKEQFLKMAQTISENIRSDLNNRFIALWHDESHLNRYYVDHEPTVILSPSYCYWQNKILPYPKRLIALDKNHHEFRS